MLKLRIPITTVLLFAMLVAGNSPISNAADLHVGPGQIYTRIFDAINASSGGDKIIIHAGIYNEKNITPKSGIDDSHRTIIIGAEGEEMPVIDAQSGAGAEVMTFNLSGNNITLSGLHIRGGGGKEEYASVSIGPYGNPANVTVTGCRISETNIGGTLHSYNPAHIRCGMGNNLSNIVISGNEIFGAAAAGIKMDARYVNSITIENNYIHDALMGIAIKWGDSTDRNISVRYNKIQNVANRGMYIDQGYVDIQHNIIDTVTADSSAVGIFLHDNFGGNNCAALHNTIYGAANYAVYMYAGGDNNTITDNILYSSSIVKDYGSGNTFSNFTDNPLFTNASNHDFTLQAGSGAIGTASDGTDMGANVSLVGIKQVKISDTGDVYFTFSNAYASANNNNTILMRAMGYDDPLNLTRNIHIILKGGYDGSFSSRVGVTTTRGLRVNAGKVTIDMVTIR